MRSKREKIIKEQEMKVEYIEEMNSWLSDQGYDFEVINYSACDFKGTRRDNQKSVNTLHLIAKHVQEFLNDPEKERQFDRFGLPLE